MQCIHINIRKSAFIILSLLINNITRIQMADNEIDLKDEESKRNGTTSEFPIQSIPNKLLQQCPPDQECRKLNATCLNCELNPSCIYGQTITTKCKTKPLIKCKGPKQFDRPLICRYCYQTEPWEHSCESKATCNAVASPRAFYSTNCTVSDNVLCLGHRTFNKNVKCNWTGGYRWSTALALSITLGGFGADRFYLGHWQEGIGKLFSFGGLGVWTIIDVILISLHYLGPADGSLYI